MQDLTVIGVENGMLVAEGDDGGRYRIPVDALPSSLTHRPVLPARQPSTVKVSPREVQSYIRGGMSASEVAELTGADIEDVRRFEGPVLAEREHIVNSALAVPVHLAEDAADRDDASFGAVIHRRLESLDASGERWAAWKEPDGGWIVKLAFTADEIDHDARWGYDPRRRALSPQNSEATTLSQQEELQGGLIPRLRVVTPGEPDDSRFDSGAFALEEEPAPAQRGSDRFLAARGANSVAVDAVKRAGDDHDAVHQTADLLEALRKRRGEREAAHAAAPSEPQRPRLVDVPLDAFADEDRSDATGEDDGPPSDRPSARVESGTRSAGRGTAKKGRASMPSWDEIVFGARTDDDLA